MRIYIIIAIVLIIGAASGGVYYMQKRIENLASLNAQLIQKNESLITTVDFLQKSAKEQEERINNLTIDLQNADEGLVELRKILADHDLTRLAIEKPGLIENRINDGTKKVFDDIISDTVN